MLFILWFYKLQNISENKHGLGDNKLIKPKLNARSIKHPSLPDL